MEQNNKIITELEIDASQSVAELNNIIKKQAELKKSTKELKDAGGELTEEYIKQQKEIKDLETEKRNLTKVIGSESKSLDQLKAMVNLLNKQYHKLSEEERDNIEVTDILTGEKKKLSTAVHDLNQEIRNQARILSNNKELIGSYGEEVERVAGSLNQMANATNNLDDVGGAVEGVASLFGPTGAIIGGLIAATLPLLKQVSPEFADMLNDITTSTEEAMLKMAMVSNSFTDNELSNHVKRMSAYDKERESIENTFDVYEKNITNQIALSTRVSKSRDQQLALLKSAGDETNKALEETNKKYSELAKTQEKLVKDLFNPNTQIQSDLYYKELNRLTELQKQQSDRIESFNDFKTQVEEGFSRVLSETLTKDLGSFNNVLDQTVKLLEQLKFSPEQIKEFTNFQKALQKSEIDNRTIQANNRRINLLTRTSKATEDLNDDLNAVALSADIEFQNTISELNKDLKDGIITQQQYNEQLVYAENIKKDAINTQQELNDTIDLTTKQNNTLVNSYEDLADGVSDVYGTIDNFIGISEESQANQEQLNYLQDEYNAALESGNEELANSIQNEINRLDAEIEADEKRREQARKNIEITKASADIIDTLSSSLERNGIIAKLLTLLVGDETRAKIKNALITKVDTKVTEENTDAKKKGLFGGGLFGGIPGIPFFAKGGIVKYADGGIVNGPSHANGGVKFYGSNGQVFEAEGGEAMIAVNKYNTPLLNQLSAINSLNNRGVDFMGINRTASATQQTTASTQAIINSNKQVIDALQNVPIYVNVTDIDKVNAKKVKVTNLAKF